MGKKHLFFMISIAFFSLLHLIFSYYYMRLYGYFNLQGTLSGFVMGSQFLRLILNAYIVICGFLALRENKKRLLPFYLLFFLFNLILPFLFQV
jgi:hypothetical protein